MALPSRKMEPGQETNMDVDYVVVYRFADTGRASVQTQLAHD